MCMRLTIPIITASFHSRRRSKSSSTSANDQPSSFVDPANVRTRLSPHRRHRTVVVLGEPPVTSFFDLGERPAFLLRRPSNQPSSFLSRASLQTTPPIPCAPEVA